jgi:hypothetical protein
MRTKTAKLLVFIVVSITFIHCKKEVKPQDIQTPKTEIPEAAKTEIKNADIKLVATLIPETKDDSIENPMSKITLSINDKQYDIAKVPGEATSMDESSAIFPKNAIASCMTWWAGSGDFFYVIQKENKVILYRGWDGEGNEGGGYNWEIAKEINL